MQVAVRTLIAAALCAALIAACVAELPASNVRPTAGWTDSLPVQTPAPSVQSTPASSMPEESTPSSEHPSCLAAVEGGPDRYPPELVGHVVITADCLTGNERVGRLGLPGRLALGPGESYLATFGDHVLTSSNGVAGTTFRLWAFGTGSRIGTDIELGPNDHFAGIAGDLLVTSSPSGGGSRLRFWSMGTGQEDGPSVQLTSIPRPVVQPAGSTLVVTSLLLDQHPRSDPGVVFVSLDDRSVQEVIGSRSVTDLSNPGRVVVVSASGKTIATTLCASAIDFVGDCRPTSVLDSSTGELLDRLDLGGAQPTILGDGWLMVSLISGDELVDLEGRSIWASTTFGHGAGTWANRVAPDGRLILELRSIAGAVRPAIVAVDPSAGRQEILYQPRDTDWHVWPQLSGDDFLAIGRGDFSPPCLGGASCDPGAGRVVEASTLDLSTGTIAQVAIQITILP